MRMPTILGNQCGPPASFYTPLPGPLPHLAEGVRRHEAPTNGGEDVGQQRCERRLVVNLVPRRPLERRGHPGGSQVGMVFVSNPLGAPS